MHLEVLDNFLLIPNTFNIHCLPSESKVIKCSELKADLKFLQHAYENVAGMSVLICLCSLSQFPWARLVSFPLLAEGLNVSAHLPVQNPVHISINMFADSSPIAGTGRELLLDKDQVIDSKKHSALYFLCR